MILKDFITKPKSKKPFIVFFLALVIFFGLRLPSLTRIPVFVDEAIYIRWSQIMRNEPSLRFLPLSDGKQPLFMWMTMPSLKVFYDPLVAGRMVSIFAGLLSLFGIAFLTLVLTENLLLASLASVIYAVLPFSVFFDRMALVDSLLSAFGLWSLGLGGLLVKKPRLDLAMLLGFAIGFGLITKAPAIFFYLWQPILFLALFDFRGKGMKKRLMSLIFYWLVTLIISQGIATIMRLGVNFNLIGSRNQDYLYTIGEVLSHPASPLIGNSKTTALWLWYLFTPPLLLCLFVSFFGRFRKISLWVVFLCLFTLLAQASVAKVYTSRYILFVATPLILPITLGLHELGTRLKKSWLVVYVFLLWPLILSGVLIASPQKANLPFDMRNGYLEEWTAGWGQKEIARYLITKAGEGKRLVVGTDGYFGTLPDGLQIYTQAIPNITVIGGAPSIKTIPESLVNSLKDKNNLVYMVANASRVSLSAQDLSRLELINSFEKPNRLDGTHESLLFYQLTH